MKEVNIHITLNTIAALRNNTFHAGDYTEFTLDAVLKLG
jgi:hypothetical protein